MTEITTDATEEKELFISNIIERQTRPVVMLYSIQFLGRHIDTYTTFATTDDIELCGDYAASQIVQSMEEIESGDVPLYNTVEELLAELDKED